MKVRSGLSASEWTGVLARLGPADPFFGPAFHAAHAANGDGEPFACLVRDGDHLLLVPGLRHAIPADPSRDDVESCPSGYAGPLTNGDASFLAAAWQAWREEMARDRVVSVFLRLHPFVGNARWLPPFAVLRRERPAAHVDLAAYAPEKRHRNTVARARRLGAVVQWDVAWDAFPALYADAMERLQAPERVRFGPAYFASLRSLGAELASVHDAAGLVAGALFVNGPRTAFYHHAVRRADAGSHVAGLLLEEAVERCRARGQDGLFLGGGRSAAPDDALLRFKQSLGGRLVDYEVAILPTDPAAFERLVADWTRQAGRSPDWLTGYRQPLPASPPD
jgi:hypothetical protein